MTRENSLRPRDPGRPARNRLGVRLVPDPGVAAGRLLVRPQSGQRGGSTISLVDGSPSGPVPSRNGGVLQLLRGGHSRGPSVAGAVADVAPGREPLDRRGI